MKIDDKIRKFIENKKNLLIVYVLAITAIAIIARILTLSFASSDYIYCLEPWMIQIKEYGGFESLKYSIGNYNILYMTIMAIISYLPNTIACIKFVSYIFDFVIAIFGSLIVLHIVNKKDNKYELASITYTALIMLPTLFLNSAVWGQCDSMYAAFILISFYCILKNKNFLAFVFAGLSFACKLQFIFVLPIYVVLYFKKKNFSIFNFIIIPVVNFITCLPAVIAGRNIIDCLKIYVAQTGQSTEQLSNNFTNIYKYIPKFFESQPSVMILITLIVIGSVTVLVLYSNNKWKDINTIELSIVYVLIMSSLLPYMHERYAYVAEVLIVLYVIIKGKDFYGVAITQFAAITEYMSFLAVYNEKLVDIATIVFVWFVGKFSIDIIKSITKKSDEDKAIEESEMNFR